MEILQFFFCILLVSHVILQVDGKRRIIPPADSAESKHDEEVATGEEKLYRELLHSYNKNVRPVLDPKQAVEVNVTLTLANIIDIDEKHQSLTTLLWMRKEWYDPFLTWNEAEYPDIRHFVIQADQIWGPDLMVYNVLGNTIQVAGEFFGKSEGLEVLPSGKVNHWTPLLLTSFCPMQMELFPFDVQSCPIVLSPWIYDNTQLKLFPSENVAEIGEFEWDVSKKWIIKDFKAQKTEILYANTRKYDQINFMITLRRKSTFYVLHLLLPCYLISIIACLCYVIPPQGGDRINLLLTTFLSIVVFVLVVLEIVPEESDTLPLFSKFLLEAMLMNILQIFYCTIVCGLNSMDQIRLRPPRCAVAWAKCMTSCIASSCCSRSNRAASKQEKTNTSNLEEKPDNETEIEFRILNENGDVDINSHIDTPDDNQSVTQEQNVKEWRIVFKAVDIMLFILTFLGLTGYFLGILVAYYH